MNDGRYLVLMCIGFLITITVETAVLVVGLSARHSMRVRLFAGIWLTACSYPIVWLFLPQLIDPFTQRSFYLLVAEVFAPAAECLLFWVAFIRPAARKESDLGVRQSALKRDMIVIVLANLASFGIGVGMEQTGVWQAIQDRLLSR